MQNLVLPFSLALRAASKTGSMSSNFEAWVGVEYREDWEQYEPVGHFMREYNQRLDCRLQSSEHPPAITTLVRMNDQGDRADFHTFDIHQGAELNLARVVVLAVYRSCSEDKI